MKITTEHYAQLNALVRRVVEKVGREQVKAHREGLKDDPRVIDIEKRFRWDFVYAVPYAERGPIIDAVYKYADDSHIDTALRKIVKELGV